MGKDLKGEKEERRILGEDWKERTEEQKIEEGRG
jgi:hypothetical protein